MHSTITSTSIYTTTCGSKRYVDVGTVTTAANARTNTCTKNDTYINNNSNINVDINTNMNINTNNK